MLRRHNPIVYTHFIRSLTLILYALCMLTPGVAQDQGRRQRILDALAEGDHPHAAELAAAWLATEPTRGLPRVYAGRAALGVGDLAAARMYLQQGVALDPEDADAWWWLGQAAEEIGDHDAALAAYWRSARLDPDGSAARELTMYNPDWLAYNAAYTEYSRGGYARCLYAAQTLSSRSDLDEGLLRSVQFMESECLLRLGRVADGLDASRMLLERHPDLRPLGVGLASIALESGLAPLAEDLLALAGVEVGLDGALVRAWCDAASGAVQESAQALARALADAEPCLDPSECLRQQSLLDGALLALAASPGVDQALTGLSQSAELQAIVGAVALLREEVDRGLGLLTAAHARDPSSLWLAERLAWGLRLTGDHERALRVLEQCGAPEAVLVRMETLDILLFTGRLTEADALLSTWRAEAPEDQLLLARHAALSAELGRYDEAMALLRSGSTSPMVGGGDMGQWAEYLELLVRQGSEWPPAVTWEGEARRLAVRVAADEEFRRDPDWALEIAQVFSRIAPIFEQVGVQMEVTRMLEWDSRDRAWTLGELHSELQREVRRDRDDLVFGFTAQAYGGGEAVGMDVAMGEAALLQDYAIVRFDRLGDITPDMRLLQVAHELAHILGACHVESDRTIMRSRMSGRPVLDLDPPNRRILYVTRNCDFDAGVASLSDEARNELIKQRQARAAEASDDPTHYVDLAHMAYELGDVTALEWARRALVVAPEELPWRILYADLLAWDRQLDVAIEEMRRLVPVALECADVAQLRSLGRSLAMVGEHAEAAALLRRTVNLAQRDGWLLTEYAATLYVGGEHELALEMLQTALDVEPDDPFLRGEIAGALLQVGRPDEALTQALTAVGADSSNPIHWERLGHIHVERDEREQAIEAFERAVEVDPEYAYAYNALAWTLVELGRFAEAEGPVTECLRLEPSYAPAIDTLGHVLNGLGRPEEGLQAFDSALKLMPREPASWYGRGASLEALGRTEEAIEAYERAMLEDLPGGEWIEKAGVRLEALGAVPDGLDGASGGA